MSMKPRFPGPREYLNLFRGCVYISIIELNILKLLIVGEITGALERTTRNIGL